MGFMSLTTDIKGVPQVYADFASGVGAFNFDIGPLLPLDKLGIPSVEDVKKYKKRMIHFLEKKMKVNHAKLLLEYCVAKHTFKHDRLMANAVLHREDKQAKELVDAMTNEDSAY